MSARPPPTPSPPGQGKDGCKAHRRGTGIDSRTVSVLDVLRVYYKPQCGFGFCSLEVITRYWNYQEENVSYPQTSRLVHWELMALRTQLSSWISQLWRSTPGTQRVESKEQPGQDSKIPLFQQQQKPPFSKKHILIHNKRTQKNLYVVFKPLIHVNGF